MDQYDIILRLTSGNAGDVEAVRLLNDFSHELGWQPSGPLIKINIEDFGSYHLIVEHGLENSAVITFLSQNIRYSELASSQKAELLSLSYNNLVDWHIYVEPEEVSYVFNRRSTYNAFDTFRISRNRLDLLRGESFDKITGKSPSPNFPALDASLIRTISFWKRSLAAEANVTNIQLSTLFNAVIFIRALEDHYNALAGISSQNPGQPSLLLTGEHSGGLGNFFKQKLAQLGHPELPSYLLNLSHLEPFDSIPFETIQSLFKDFYRNRFAPYRYDFSLISKHALSRIYEHYISLLREPDSAQFAMFGVTPEEHWEKGNVYTPHYVARFFAKYLQSKYPQIIYRKLRVLDPSCGSGMFLRTILELQCDPGQTGFNTEIVSVAFANTAGIDIDPSACEAARLSLALLHLTLRNQLPDALNIKNADLLEAFSSLQEGSTDVIISNPPYIRDDALPEEARARLVSFLGKESQGRTNLYQAFLKAAIDLLSPGGYGLFVIPHDFLLNKSAEPLRKYLVERCWITCIVDLTSIPVFENLGTYVILLIFQRKHAHQLPERAIIAKCGDLVGQALQNILEGKEEENSFFQVYAVDQKTFERQEWHLLSSSESALDLKMSGLPRLEDFLVIREGFITGADKIFIMDTKDIPRGEESLFVPYLPDRTMQGWTVPRKTNTNVFYPFKDGVLLNESELKKYTKTWDYLKSNRKALADRKSAKNKNIPWWQPLWPRLPQNMMRPKLVSPHLVLLPKFSIDTSGKYATSHSPILYPKAGEGDSDMLKYFLAILNSTVSYWYMATHLHKYRAGYLKLEPMGLKSIPVPDPAKISPHAFSAIIQLVDLRLKARPASSIAEALDKKLNIIIADIYGLSKEERNLLRIGDDNEYYNIVGS